MDFFRRTVCFVLCLLLISPVLKADASERESAIRQDIISYYFHYREKAAKEIENQLHTLTDLNPETGEQWKELMRRWAWINEEMDIHTGVLPDGLPEDDSLCIVVLGYGLEKDGSMKQELVDRLEVALESAGKYPQAYVLCTGGETSHEPGISEAGQMGTWLRSNGLEQDRLILEGDSLSTTENAQRSSRILWREYPQVKSIAIVTSDYHIRWGAACFMAMNLLHGGEKELELVGNAACVTDSPNKDTMFSQAWGISIIADIPFDSGRVPPLYMSEETEPPETEAVPMIAAEPIAEVPQKREPVALVLAGLAGVLLILFVPKKRRKSGSD